MQYNCKKYDKTIKVMFNQNKCELNQFIIDQNNDKVKITIKV